MNRYNQILTELKKLANNLFANLPASVYLYGSRARHDADRDSDWDILIVTDDSMNIKDAFEKFAYPFTEIGWKLGEQITLFYIPIANGKPNETPPSIRT